MSCPQAGVTHIFSKPNWFSKQAWSWILSSSWRPQQEKILIADPEFHLSQQSVSSRNSSRTWESPSSNPELDAASEMMNMISSWGRALPNDWRNDLRYELHPNDLDGGIDDARTSLEYKCIVGLLCDADKCIIYTGSWAYRDLNLIKSWCYFKMHLRKDHSELPPTYTPILHKKEGQRIRQNKERIKQTMLSNLPSRAVE